jgi:hypothetical protein
MVEPKRMKYTFQFISTMGGVQLSKALKDRIIHWRTVTTTAENLVTLDSSIDATYGETERELLRCALTDYRLDNSVDQMLTLKRLSMYKFHETYKKGYAKDPFTASKKQKEIKVRCRFASLT